MQYAGGMIGELRQTQRVPMRPPDMTNALTTDEAAPLLGVSADTLFLWRRKGYGPPYTRVGPRKILYDRAELLAWLAARHTTHEEPTG